MENQIFEFFTNINLIPLWLIILFVFVSACIQQIFPPYPSDTLVLLMGVLAGAGTFPWYYLIITYFLGTIFSSILLYEYSYVHGEKVLKTKLIKALVDDKSIERAKKFANKVHGFAFVLSRFAPGMFSVMLIIGGVVKLKRVASWLFICLASAVGCVIYFIVGLLIGNNREILIKFGKGMGIFGVVLLVGVVVIGFIVYKVRKGKQKK